MRRRWLAPSLALALLAAGSCTETAAPDVTPASIALTPADPLTLAAGTSATLVATVRNAAGEPLTGVVTAFTSSAPAVVSVNQSGLVASVGPIGEASITAAIGAVQSPPVLVTVVAGAAATVAKVGSDPAEVTAGASFGDSVRVKVTDAFGNPKAGVAVAFAVTAGGGSIAPASVTTDAEGLAAARFLTGAEEGTNTATATVAGLTPVTFSIATSPVPVASVSLTPDSSGMVVGATQQMAVTVVDANGNGVPASEVSWTVSDASIARLAQPGVLEGLTPGVARIIASVRGVADTALVSVEPLTEVTQGTAFSCGLTTTGVAYCWGNNSEGALGNGTYTNSNVPVAVAGGLRFRSLSVGGTMAAGLTADGTAYTWGFNRHGGLGVGDTIMRNVPTPVATSLRFASIHAGDVHMVALTPSGAAYAWGNYYQSGTVVIGVGNGESNGTTSPVAVSGGLAFRTVSAGMGFSLGITTGGETYAWGSNQFGKLGVGSTDVAKLVPTPVAGGHAFVSVSAGGSHALALTADGTPWAWGDNHDFGQLGDGTNTNRDAPVQVSGGLTFSQVSAGQISSYALTADGRAYSWGGNHTGQLGNGETSNNSGDASFNVLTPEPVLGGLTFRSIASGGVHVIAFTKDGKAYGWGHNGLGSIGDGTNTVRLQPVAAAAGIVFK